MHKNDLFTRVYHGTPVSRLHFSKALFRRLGSQIMQDASFCGAFATLRESSSTLSVQMGKMQVGKTCISCSAANRGGCCSKVMAEETDAIQMLMNMLNGVEINFLADNGTECSFLGEKGCIFLFKPMFCLNYNCHKILDAAAQGEKFDLERLTGRLLGNQYDIEKMLFTKITAISSELFGQAEVDTEQEPE